jgi:acid phosphatase type 7
MNSETAVDTQDFHKKQLSFFQDEVNKVDRAHQQFVVTHFHRPLYCSDDGTCSQPGKPNKLSKQAETMFYNAKVDLCITGHVHAYERTLPVYNEQVMTTDLASKTYAAPIYILQGASGNRENNKGESSWPNPEPAWSAGHSSEVGYGLLTVESAAASAVPTLHWTFFRSSDNEALDSFTLSK